MNEPSVRRSSSATRIPPTGGSPRQALSAALAILAAACALTGGLALYAREEIVNPSAFADRAVDAAHRPTVKRVVARLITVQVLEPRVPDLVAARPVIQSALTLVVGSRPFEPVIRLAAEHGERLLFERGGGNAVFDVADAGTLISSALRSLAPNIARAVPARADAVLLTLRQRSFASQTLRAADRVRTLGIVLPPLAIALFALAVAIVPERRRGITRGAVALGATGIAFAVAFELFRRYVVSHVDGTGALTNADVRGAVGELWDAYLGDILTWTLAVTVIAWLVAAASASVLAPYSATDALRWLSSLARRPLPPRARAVRGALVLAVGVLVVLEPSAVLRAAAIIGGCVLVYVGVGELLSAFPAQLEVKPPGPHRSRRMSALGALGATIAAVVAFAVVFTGGTRNVRAGTVMACNGYRQLCDRRLDELVFAGTHNAMSAADSRGWLIANQDRDVAQQLADGIRLFKISTHYGTADSAGWVHTDIAGEGQQLNRVSAKLDPRGRAALERLSRSLTPGSLAGRKRDIWLCHTLCELGATRMVDFLTTVRRFLELNPDQVIVFFDEDYVSERDLQGVFERAGLFRYLATLQPGQPLPTLAELVRARHNVVVFAQEPPSGKYAWNANAFTWIQDTPLGATRPSQFSCKLYRGHQGNPLLMMNNWADVFPPRPSPNLPLVKRAFILSRARQCVQQRGRVPNLILTDFYNRGEVAAAVAELNGLSGQRPVETVPVTQ